MRIFLNAVLFAVLAVMAGDNAFQNAFAQSGNKIPSDVMTRYTVEEDDDNLASIAEQDAVYGDAMLWPLIFRVNTDRISDPDELEPGTVLVIPRNMSQEEMDEASSYAKKRENASPEMAKELDLEYLRTR